MKNKRANLHDRINKEANSEIESTKDTEGKSDGQEREEGYGHERKGEGSEAVSENDEGRCNEDRYPRGYLWDDQRSRTQGGSVWSHHPGPGETAGAFHHLKLAGGASGDRPRKVHPVLHLLHFL